MAWCWTWSVQFGISRKRNLMRRNMAWMALILRRCVTECFALLAFPPCITNALRVSPSLPNTTQVYVPRLSSSVTATSRWLSMMVPLLQDITTTPGLWSPNSFPSFSHLMDDTGWPRDVHVRCAISSFTVFSVVVLFVKLFEPKENEKLKGPWHQFWVFI